MFTDGFKGVDTPPLMFTHGFEGVAMPPLIFMRAALIPFPQHLCGLCRRRGADGELPGHGARARTRASERR